MKKKHFKWIDLIRCIAVLLVLYGHIIVVGTWAPTIPEIVSEENATMYLPLLSSEEQSMWKLESVFEAFGTQSAIVGVFLFFLLAGYLSVGSHRKYEPKEFIINRCVRLFPVLLVSTILATIIAYTVQGICFNIVDVLGQGVAITALIQTRHVLGGVLWTLSVELIFYLFIIHTREMNMKFIVICNMMIMCVILLCAYNQSPNMAQIVYYVRYIPIVYIGVAIKLAEEKNNYVNKCIMILSTILMSWGILNINKNLNGDTTTYPNIGSFMVSLAIFIGIYILAKKLPLIDDKIPSAVTFISKISYALYLIQLPVGINFMFLMKKYFNMNPYVNVVLAVVVIFIVSVGIYMCVEKTVNKWYEKYRQKI